MPPPNKFWCRICDEYGEPHFNYSKDGLATHLRNEHAAVLDEDVTYEQDMVRVARLNRELREARAEQERRDRIAQWEYEQSLADWEGIDTVDDFLRACGVT